MKKLLRFAILLIGVFTISCEQSIDTGKKPLTKVEIISSLSRDENIISVSQVKEKYDKMLFEEFAKLSYEEFKGYKRLLDEHKYDDARTLVKASNIQIVLDNYNRDLKVVAHNLFLKYSQDFKSLDSSELNDVFEKSLQKTSENSKKAGGYCSDFCEGYQYAVSGFALTQAVLCLSGYSSWCGTNGWDYGALAGGVACAFCCLNNQYCAKV